MTHHPISRRKWKVTNRFSSIVFKKFQSAYKSSRTCADLSNEKFTSAEAVFTLFFAGVSHE